MSPRVLLHLEGAAAFLVSLIAYRWSHASWLLFALLFLVPDLSLLGYLANVRVGAVSYNAVHTYLAPLALAAYGAASDRLPIFSISLIWIAHIAFDRMLGFGLKYPTRFKDTHLSAEHHTT
jgi:hypothetical protein